MTARLLSLWRRNISPLPVEYPNNARRTPTSSDIPDGFGCQLGGLLLRCADRVALTGNALRRDKTRRRSTARLCPENHLNWLVDPAGATRAKACGTPSIFVTLELGAGPNRGRALCNYLTKSRLAHIQ